MLLVGKKFVFPQVSNIDLNNAFNQSGETSENSWYFAKPRNLHKILFPPQQTSKTVPTAIPKTQLGNKKNSFFETYHYGAHSLK